MKEFSIPPAAHPSPGLSLGDILRWEPVLAQIVPVVEAAIAGGSTTVPAIKVHIAGKHVVIGPCPVTVE